MRIKQFLNRTKKSNFTKRLLASMLALLILLPSIFIFFRPQKASADWFDDNYSYRQKISFTYNSDITSERRVSISVDTGTGTTGLIDLGKMQSDCDDTRFTDLNGKVLRFQMTSTCSSSGNTTFDVVFPSIINGTNVGYIYYGNPSALSRSENVSSVTSITPTSPSVATEEKAPSPALSLKFDEGYGQTAYDTSSNKNNGTLTNDPTWQTEDMCISGKCLKFDGVNDYVNVGNGSSLNMTNAVTIEAWVKLQDDGVNKCQWIAGKKDQTCGFGTGGYGLYYGWNNDLNFSIGTQTAGQYIYYIVSSAYNNWHHVVGVYDGTNLKLYVDGILVNSATATVSLTTVSDAFKIGHDNAGNLFKGFIDDVRVYPYARTASQIKTDAASRIPSVHGISASFGDDQSYLSNGLVGYWKMDDGVNNPCASGVDKACDSSGNGNVGTWTNGVASTSGKFGNGTSYDGVDDYVETNESSLPTGANPSTFSVWFKPSATCNSNTILGYGNNATSQARGIQCIDDTTIRFFSWNNDYDVTVPSIGTSTWHHIAAVYDGTNATVYFDGINKGSTPKTWNTVAGGTFRIGRLIKTYGAYFSGSIDDVRIYNRALSPSEVTRLYDWAPGPVGWWKMDENTGSLANDSSGNKNNGGLISWRPDALSGWKYRIPLTVSNSGSALTDYQASVSANTSTPIAAGKMQSDCDDIRFYDSDNATPLNYWYESNCNNPTTGAVFWVKIPSIPNGSKTIYMYYGNPSVTAGSNGENTFQFFDEFNGSSLDGTKWPSQAGSITVSGGELHVDIVSNIGHAGFLAQNSTGTLTFKGKYSTDAGVVRFGTNSENTIGMYANGTSVYLWDSGSKTFGSSGPDIYHKYTFAYKGATGIDHYFDYIYKFNRTDTTNIGTYYFGNSTQESGRNGDVWIDWVYIRKYAATEPTVTAGSETAISSSSPWARGKIGSALSFDGVDDYINIPSSSSFSLNNFTIMSWVYVPNSIPSGWRAILEHNRSGNNHYGLWKSGNADKFHFRWASDQAYDFNTTITGGNWYHVVGTWDGATAKMYLNGVLDRSITAGSPSPTLDKITIGSCNSGCDWFSGSIDDVRVYNYTRTSKQIVSDMNAGHPAVGSPVGSAVAHWKFDEGFGTTAHNSGNCATCSGTLTNMDSPATYGSGWTNNGKFQKALNFDGTNDYVNTTGFTSTAQSYTFAFWVKSTQSSTLKYLFDSEFGRLVVAWNGQNSGKLAFYDGTWRDSTVNAPNDGLWHHLVYVLNSSTSLGYIYIDGNLVDSSLTYAAKNIGGSSAIGARYTGSLYFFSGTLDSVSVYNYALSAQEIKVDYNRGAAVVWGATSTNPDNRTASNSAARSYCPPGNNETNCAGTGVLNPAPVGEWKFDENTGQSVNDTSGNANTGTLTNGPAWTPGKIGSALKFDGVDDYVDAGNGASLNITDAITIDAWIKNKGSNTDIFYVSKIGNTTSRVYGIGAFSGKPILWLSPDGTQTNRWYRISTKDLSSDRAWHHIVGTFSASSGTHIYVDGILTDGTITGTEGSSIGTTTTNLMIGGSFAGGQYFNGAIDNVTIYNYARTAAQIAWDYNRGKPAGWWRFDECQGATAHDASGNGNNGAITAGGNGNNDSVGTCNSGAGNPANEMWNAGTTGKFNSSLSFDGMDDYVNVGSLTNLNITNAITISAWVKGIGQATKGVITKYDYTLNKRSYAILTNAVGSDKMQVLLSDNGTAAKKQYVSSVPVFDDSFHFITATSDGTDLKIYVDGNLDTNPTKTIDLSMSGLYQSDLNTHIGSEIVNGTNTRFFSGLIDDVRVYNYALTPAQIRTLYNEDSAIRFGPASGSP